MGRKKPQGFEGLEREDKELKLDAIKTRQHKQRNAKKRKVTQSRWQAQKTTGQALGSVCASQRTRAWHREGGRWKSVIPPQWKSKTIPKGHRGGRLCHCWQGWLRGRSDVRGRIPRALIMLSWQLNVPMAETGQGLGSSTGSLVIHFMTCECFPPKFTQDDNIPFKWIHADDGSSERCPFNSKWKHARSSADSN